jgi:hypothetical protein
LPPVQARRQARVLRVVLGGLAEEIVTLCGPPEGERSLALAERITDRGVRVILTEHLDAVLSRAGTASTPGPTDAPGPAPRRAPVDRAG